MRTSTLISAAISGLLAASAGAGVAQAAPSLQVATAPIIDAVYTPGGPSLLKEVQYVWGGRNYCWYDGGWHGPGYYWCGYAWRSGFGWGGGRGWRWGGGGYYHGAGYGVHRGRYGGGRYDHGGGHFHGGHGGGEHHR